MTSAINFIDINNGKVLKSIFFFSFCCSPHSPEERAELLMEVGTTLARINFSTLNPFEKSSQ
jgi:hypothetical protein